MIAEPDLDARRVRAALRIYASFGLMDLVKEMMALAAAKALLNDADKKMVSQFLDTLRYAKSSDASPGFVHKVLMKLSRILSHAGRAVEPTMDERSWSNSDEELG